jgi:nucleoside-diphosphate-sugar epimerase
MANILITGASGFLGRHLAQQLKAEGHNVFGLSRSARADAILVADAVTPVRGDLMQPEQLATAFAKPFDAVFHTAADTSQWAPNDDRQTRVNVEGSRALAEAALAAGVAAFIHTSSVSAYSHLVHGTLREDVPQRGGESWITYERSKHLGEQAVRAVAARGLPLVVMQPAHILGPGDTSNWSRLIRLIDQGKLPGVPPGSGSFADVREVARAQVRAWQRGRFGETYLLGGEHLRFLELVTRVGNMLGRKTPSRATPGWALMAWARVVDAVSRITRREPDITPRAAMFVIHDLIVDSGKAQRELDYAITPMDRLLDDTIAWLRSEGLLRRE